MANYDTVPTVETDKIHAHRFKDSVGVEGSISNFDIVWDKSEPTKSKRHIQLLRKGSNPPIYVDAHTTWGKVLEDFGKK